MSAVPLDTVVEPVIGWRGWSCAWTHSGRVRTCHEGPERLAVARSHDGAVRGRARASQPGPLVRMRPVRVQAGDGAPMPPVAVPGDRDRVDVGSDRGASARVARRACLPRPAPVGVRCMPPGPNRPANGDPRRGGNDLRGCRLAGVRVRLVRRPRPVRAQPEVVGIRGRQGALCPGTRSIRCRSSGSRRRSVGRGDAAHGRTSTASRRRRCASTRPTSCDTCGDSGRSDVRTPRPGRDIPQLMPADVNSKDRPSEPSSTGIDEAAGCSSVSASITSSWSSVCSGS